MATLRFLGLLTTLVAAVFAAPPENLAGHVFTEFVNVRGVGSAQWSSRRELLLNRDGSYTGLFFSRGGPMFPVPQVEIPASGRWTYRTLDEKTGQLTLDGIAHSLTFTSDFNGSIPSPDVFFTMIQFSLTPYEAATPLTNCSNRSFVRAGSSAFTGFVITSASRGRVLVRAVGPGLTQFGIADALRRPTLTITRANTASSVGTNSGGAHAPGIVGASARAGAFPLPDGTIDSALLLSLDPAAYVAQVSSADSNDSGQVLIEVYMLP